VPRIALSQTTATEDLATNLEVARAHIRKAAAMEADLVAFPEVFLYVGPRQGKFEHAQDLDGAVVSELRELAAACGILVLLGSIHERIPSQPQRLHNTSVLLGAAGEMLAVYRKRNLFDLELPQLRLCESDTIAPGLEPPPVVDTPIGRVGLSVCFDLRFSELYLGLRERGAELVFIPSNFTVPTGQAHWEVLLRARAIEGQFYVAAPAQTGKHNPDYSSHGHGMLVDPWGRVLVLNDGGPGLVCGEVDASVVARVRRDLPMKRS